MAKKTSRPAPKKAAVPVAAHGVSRPTRIVCHVHNPAKFALTIFILENFGHSLNDHAEETSLQTQG
jgi:hypothetical protein